MERREALHGEEGLVSSVAAEPRPRRAIGRRVPLPTEPLLNLAVLGQPVFSIVVYGTPVSQGSKGVGGSYRKRTKAGAVVTVPRLVDTSDLATKTRAAGGLSRWREAIAAEAIAALPHDWKPLDGPLVADAIVSLPRLAATPKTLRTLPVSSEDLSKLTRATEDALGTTCAQIGRRVPVLINDARIVSYRRLDKVFAGDALDPDALRQPGAVLRLWRYPEHLLGRVDRG